MSAWITGTIEALGYPGIVLLMLLEAVFPPIPSELIIPFAGYLAARGGLDPVLVVLSASAGSLLGMIPWYLAGRLFGLTRCLWLAERYGRWLTVTRADVERAGRWFERFGWMVVAFGRLLPIIRTLISVPAGLARMRPVPFVAASGCGILAWNTILVGAGYVLAEHYALVERFVDPLAYLVLGGIGLVYVWRVATQRGGG